MRRRRAWSRGAGSSVIVLFVEGRVIIEGAMDLGRLVGVEICGIDVGVVERTGRCVNAVVSICDGRVDGLVGIYTGVVGSEMSHISVLSTGSSVR